MKTKEKHYYVVLNGVITSYVTAKTINQAIKKVRKEFPPHFEVTSWGLVD